MITNNKTPVTDCLKIYNKFNIIKQYLQTELFSNLYIPQWFTINWIESKIFFCHLNFDFDNKTFWFTNSCMKWFFYNKICWRLEDKHYFSFFYSPLH